VPALAPLPKTVPIPVPPGTRFTMGCVPGRDIPEGADCEKEGLPQRQDLAMTSVCDMGVYEVTFLEYDYYIWATVGKLKSDRYPPDKGWGRDQRPVINVSWHDAEAYAKWLSGKTGQTYRLPTEKEWEYAARRGHSGPYPWGVQFPQGRAHCDGCNPERWWVYANRTAPVGSYPSGRSADGLYDMAGNVWEWMANTSDRAETSADRWRGLRGGSWDHRPRIMLAAHRLENLAGSRRDVVGFRVCRGSPVGTEATSVAEP